MKSVISVLIAQWLMMATGVAWAQTACPQGVASGSAQCGPSTVNDPAYSGVPAAPRARWADSWGAMASDVEKGVSGIVAELPSKRLAKRFATQECKARGGEKCKIAMTYKNQCFVVVDGNGSYFVSAATIKRAEDLAMRNCEQGGGDCHVYYYGCSHARRIR